MHIDGRRKPRKHYHTIYNLKVAAQQFFRSPKFFLKIENNVPFIIQRVLKFTKYVQVFFK